MLTGQADSAKKASFFSLITLIHFFKYETIVGRNGLCLGYSERDARSVSGMIYTHTDSHTYVIHR